MSGVKSSASDVDVDLARLFGSLAVRWKRILLVALAATGLALAIAWSATPHYRGETRILIESRESVFTRPEQEGANDQRLLDEEGVTSQVQVITSTDLLKQVAKELDLARLPEFDEAADMSLLSRLLVVAGLKSDPGAIPPEERVLKAFREKLNVYRVERSRVIVIEMSSEDPRLAAGIANALADAYVATQSAAKLQSDSDATDWLEPEIANLSARVKEAEARVASFRAQSDLLVGQNNSVLATQQLSELSSELSRVRANRGAAEANAASVRAVLESGASLDALPEVLSSPLIQRLRERQVQLQADIADLSTTLLDNHPRIRSLRSQLADLERQIRNEAQNVLKALGAEANAARLREQQLVADLNQLKSESARAGEEEVELRALEREANAQRELLESYLARYREASSRKDGNYLPADARIFSRAVAPSEPYFPKPLPIAGAAFVGSLLVMAIVTLLQELFSGRAMRPAASPALPARPVESEPEYARLAIDPASTTPQAPAVTDPAAAEPEPAHPDAEEPARVEVAQVEVAPAEPSLGEAGTSLPPASGGDDQAAEHASFVSPAALQPERISDVDNDLPLRVVVSRTVEPIRYEPLPEMRVERPSFREAWERHKRIMQGAHIESPANEPGVAPRREEEIELPPAAGVEAWEPQPNQHAEEPESAMFNPFARRKSAPEEPEVPVSEVDVASAAEILIAGGATRAIFVSPEGDEGAAAAVMVAREVADAGLRVLLLDLTASGAASRPTLESVTLPGITDLLVSEAQFTDAIHPDLYSDCQVMPVGTADPVKAMKAADRLPHIMESLTSAYDVVVVECGASNAEGIRRLVADGTEIMVSVIEHDDETSATAAALKARGYGRVMLVSPVQDGLPDSPQPGRSAA